MINSSAKNVEPNQEVRVAFQITDDLQRRGFVVGNEIVRKNGQFGFFVPNFILPYNYKLTPIVFGYGSGPSKYCFEEYRDFDRPINYYAFGNIEDYKINSDRTFKVTASIGLAKGLGSVGDKIRLEYCFDVYIVDKDGYQVVPNNGMYRSSMQITKATDGSGAKNKYQKIEFSPRGVYLNEGERACAKLFVRQEGSEIFSTPTYCFPGLPYVITEKPTNAKSNEITINGLIRNFQGAKQLYGGFAIISSWDVDNIVTPDKNLDDYYNGKNPDGNITEAAELFYEPWIDWTQLPKSSFIWVNNPIKSGSNVRFSAKINPINVPDDSSGDFFYIACAGPQKDENKLNCGKLTSAEIWSADYLKAQTLPPKILTTKDATGRIINTQFIPQGKVLSGGFFRKIYTYFSLVYPEVKDSLDIYHQTQFGIHDNFGESFNFEADSPIELTGEIIRKKICYVACAAMRPIYDPLLASTHCDYENKQCFDNPEYINPDIENKSVQFFPFGETKGFSISGAISNRSKYGRLYVGYKYYSANDPTNIVTVFDQPKLELQPNVDAQTLFAKYDTLTGKAKKGKLFTTFCIRESDTQEPICAPNWLSGTFEPVPDVISFDDKKFVEKGAVDPNISLFGQINNIQEYPSVKGGFRIIPSSGDTSQATYFWTSNYLSGGNKQYIDYSIGFRLSQIRNKSAKGIYYYSACAQDQMARIFCNEKEKYLIDISNCNTKPKIKLDSLVPKDGSGTSKFFVLSADIDGEICRDYYGCFEVMLVDKPQQETYKLCSPTFLIGTRSWVDLLKTDDNEFVKFCGGSPWKKIMIRSFLKDEVGGIIPEDSWHLVDLSKFNPGDGGSDGGDSGGESGEGCTIDPKVSIAGESSIPAKKSTDEYERFYYNHKTEGIVLNYNVHYSGDGKNDKCLGVKTSVRKGSCSGEKLSECEVSTSKYCTLLLNIKPTPQSLDLVFCADNNKDGQFSENKEIKLLNKVTFIDCVPDVRTVKDSSARMYVLINDSKLWLTVQGKLGGYWADERCQEYFKALKVAPFEDEAKQEFVYSDKLQQYINNYYVDVQVDQLVNKSKSRKYYVWACLKGVDGKIFCDPDKYLVDGSKVDVSGCSADLTSLRLSNTTGPMSELGDESVYSNDKTAGNVLLGYRFLITVPISNLSDCRDRNIELHYDSCNGELLGGCKLRVGANPSLVECDTKIFEVSRDKDRVIYSCFDRNMDGKFDEANEENIFKKIKFLGSAVLADFDWRNKDGKNWITPVGDQGRLGACISFATCASMESRYRIEQGKADFAIDLSEMWLHSKLDKYISSGNGIGLAQVYIDSVTGQGIPDESVFPYNDNAVADTSQYTEKGTTAINILPKNNDQTARMIQVLKRGPFRVGIHMNDGTPSDTTAIKNGFLECAKGRPSSHAVAIVGYKVTKGDENSPEEGYWIVKNSWGISSGDNGYIKVRFNDCDINREIIELSGINRPNK